IRRRTCGGLSRRPWRGAQRDGGVPSSSPCVPSARFWSAGLSSAGLSSSCRPFLNPRTASPRSWPTFFRRLVPNTSTTITSTTSQCQRLRPPMCVPPVSTRPTGYRRASRLPSGQRLDRRRVLLDRLERGRLRRGGAVLGHRGRGQRRLGGGRGPDRGRALGAAGGGSGGGGLLQRIAERHHRAGRALRE